MVVGSSPLIIPSKASACFDRISRMRKGMSESVLSMLMPICPFKLPKAPDMLNENDARNTIAVFMFVVFRIRNLCSLRCLALKLLAN